MFKQGYFITAELRVKNQQRIAEAKSALITLCEKTLSEPGCSLFTLHQCAENKDRFILWERFEDETAFKQHFLEPHTKEYMALDLTEVIQYFQSDIINA